MCRRITEPRNGKLPPPDYHRFLSKVVCMLDTMCWEWTAQLWDGYGKISIANGKKLMRAHRYSYLLYNGFLEDGQVVMHLCDNRKCVNPAHLQAGTQKENIRDMIAKGRDRNIRKMRRQLTDAQVSEIRSRWKFREVTQAMLAKEYGVPTHVVSKAVRGLTYRSEFN